MNEHGHVQRSPPPSGNFLRSRAGIVLIGFTAIAGLLLPFEHRAYLLTGNGFQLLLLALCVGMHFVMHGCHGGGGRGPGEGVRP